MDRLVLDGSHVPRIPEDNAVAGLEVVVIENSAVNLELVRDRGLAHRAAKPAFGQWRFYANIERMTGQRRENNAAGLAAARA